MKQSIFGAVERFESKRPICLRCERRIRREDMDLCEQCAARQWAKEQWFLQSIEKHDIPSQQKHLLRCQVNNGDLLGAKRNLSLFIGEQQNKVS